MRLPLPSLSLCLHSTFSSAAEGCLPSSQMRLFCSSRYLDMLMIFLAAMTGSGYGSCVCVGGGGGGGWGWGGGGGGAGGGGGGGPPGRGRVRVRVS